MMLANLNKEILVNRSQRWLVYHRLQELDIPCESGSHKPLFAEINTPTAAIQLWCVVRRLRISREELITLLESCWELKIDEPED